MQWKQIFDQFTEQERLEILQAMLGRVAHPKKRLRPAHLVIPAMMAQLMIIFYSSWLPNNQMLYFEALGNFVIAGLAMLPAAFPQKRYRFAHWVH